MIKIKKITGKQCETTRSLWEEVFWEDSREFTDYYYENKVHGNIGYVIGEEPYEAMMFRTPYNLQIGKNLREISYLVGVATRIEYRHRGFMKRLLQQSFEDMYREKNPFTFLMPADPKIYEPFGFKYIYESFVWKLKDGENNSRWLSLISEQIYEEPEVEIRAAESAFCITVDCCIERDVLSPIEFDGLYSVEQLCKQFPKFPVMKLLAEFSNRHLKEHYHIFIYRDEAYYKRQLKESKAQNGDIYVFFRQGEIQAYFLYAKEENEVFIQEVIEKEEGILEFLQKEEPKKPVIMARIIHLEEMLKLVRGHSNINVILRIRDEWIEQNSGVYQWVISENGNFVRKLEDSVKEEISLHISELASLILKDVFINELV